MKKFIIISLIFMLVCICTTGAVINVTADEIGDSYIKWSWNTGLTITNVSVDGYQVLLADREDYRFTLSDCQKNESHTIKVYTATDTGTNTTVTTKGSSPTDSILSNLDIYFVFILGIVCLLVASFAKGLQILGLGGLVFASLTAMGSIGNNTIMLLLGVLLAFASIYVVFSGE